MYKETGRKPVGQTASTGFQVGVRRTLPVTQEQAWEYLTSSEGIKWWIGDLPSIGLKAGDQYISKEGTFGEMRVVKPLQQLRLTWQKKDWKKPSTLQIRFISSNSGKTTISIHQENLADLSIREKMKHRWEEALITIISHFKEEDK